MLCTMCASSSSSSRSDISPFRLRSAPGSPAYVWFLTTRNTFSTTLTLGKVHKETGYFYHTGIFIHDYQSAGSHDSIQFLYRIKVQRRIQLILDQTSAGRSADLYALESSTTLESAADIINNMTKCCSHRYFDQTGIFNGTGQRECLCSWLPRYRWYGTSLHLPE